MNAKEFLKKIIERAEQTAENLFPDAAIRMNVYLAGKTNDQKREYLNNLWNEYRFQYPLYDVSDKTALLKFLEHVWRSKEFPYRKKENGSPWIRDNQPKNKKIHFLLWNQFLTLKLIRRLEEYLNMPEKPGINENRLTTGQVALFFYYLVEGRCIDAPKKSEWDALLRKYGFRNSPTNVYLHYCKIGKGKSDKSKISDPMTVKNIACVSKFLKPYRAAFTLAEKDHYDKEREFSE